MTTVSRVAGAGRGAWRVARAARVLAAVELGMRRSPVPEVAQRFGVRVGDDGPSTLGSVMPHDVWRARAAVARAGRAFGARGRCLRESIALGALCATHAPVLRLGVLRAPDGALLAHAWIELDGVTFDSESVAYAVLEGSIR